MNVASVHGEPAKPMSAVRSPSACFDKLQCARDVLQTFAQRVHVEPRDVRRRAQSEVHLNPVIFVKAIFLSQTFGDDENVAEQNRRIKIEPADRLKRHFGGEFGRLDQFKEGMFFLEFAIFRQCASRLPHEPDRRAVNGFAVARIEEPLTVRQCARGRFCLSGGRNGHVSWLHCCSTLRGF